MMKSMTILFSLLNILPAVTSQAQYLYDATEFIANNPSPYGSTAFNSIAYAAQRYAMSCLYFATYAQTNEYMIEEDNYDGWDDSDNWVTDKGVCEWYGVTCDENNFVRELDLSGNNLGGTFPNEVSVIASALEYLDISNNPTGSFLSGMFWLGQMTKLTHLDIHNTNFDHAGIPPYFGNLVNLKHLDISSTYIWYYKGWDAFSTMINLEWLDLSVNYYEGEVPTQILNLPKLKNLYIFDSYFSGSLDFMDQMSDTVIEIWADLNWFEPGPIPSSLFSLTNLKGLSLTSCQLTGTIPTEFGNLDKLESVWLFNNTLTDSIPNEIGDMENLKLFQTEDNMLTGTMPESVCTNFESDVHPLSALATDCLTEVECDCCNCCEFECDCDKDGCYVDGVPQDPINGDSEEDTPAPTTGGGFGGGFCFSGETTVNVFDKGIVAIADLEIGDEVQVEDEYSRVYSFGHYNKDTTGEFLQIHTSNTKPLELSKDHMIYVQNKEAFVPASTVTVGDKLLSNNNNVEVTKIDTVTRKGVFAPFTESGTISVNGIMASNYITMQDDRNKLTIAGVPIASMQRIAHSFTLPHRVICNNNKEFCSNETYSSSGISHWVYGPYLASKWLLNNQLLIVVVGLLATFSRRISKKL